MVSKQRLLEILDEYDDDARFDEYELSRILRDEEEAKQEMIERAVERLHNSGFYAQQDLIDSYRRER